MRVRLSAEARADVFGIVQFSATQWGVAKARSYVGGLTERLKALAENPRMGPPVEHIDAGLRRYSYLSHIAYYRIRENEIIVVRVLHKHMLAEKHLR